LKTHSTWVSSGTTQLAVRKESTDLRGVFAAAVETLQPIISMQGNQLTTTALAEAAITDGDAGCLTQVPVNLLINAAKITEPGGCISLSLEQLDCGGYRRQRTAHLVRDLPWVPPACH
jgi:signal transduction histidine kinase